jgi:peptide/nickel transport system permease protein
MVRMMKRLASHFGAIMSWISIFKRNKLGLFGIATLAVFVVLALFGPQIAPYDPERTFYMPDGTPATLQPPSWNHWFGTDLIAKDILSEVITGAAVSVSVGFITAAVSVLIGTTIGLLSGFYGGVVDEGIMRITDIVYGIPFLPFVIVIVALLGPSLPNMIVALSLISWRSTARVVRAQVLTVKERAFVDSAKIMGARRLRKIHTHIVPQIMPISLYYTAMTMGWAIIAETSVSFLGFGDPHLQSWGGVLFMARYANAMRYAWWWVVPPGVFIVLLVLSTFLVGRAIEEVVNPRLREI